MSTRALLGLLLAAFLLFPSLGVVQKYAGTRGALVYAVAGTVVLVVWALLTSDLRFRLQRVGSGRAWLVVGVIVCGLALSLTVLYPLATSGEASWLSPSGIVGGGSDRDDALNAGVRAVVAGRYPYYERTQLANAISQLPGSFLLAAPFVLVGNVALQNLAWFCVWIFAARSCLGDIRQAGMTASLILVGSPVVMQDFVTGGDLGTNSMVVMVAVVVLGWATGKGPAWKLAAGLFAGVAFATRLPFMLLLPLVFVRLTRKAGWHAGATACLVVAATAACITLPFYFYDPAGFAPLTVQNKFSQFFSLVLPRAGFVFPAVSLAAGLLLAVLARTATTAWWLIACGVSLLFPAVLLTLLPVVAGSTDLSFSTYGLPAVFFGVAGCCAELLRVDAWSDPMRQPAAE